MTSTAKIEANRRNALKSTGPKTERGKALVAGNALRHGLRAEKLICFDEQEGDFVAFHQAQRAVFAPADAVEEQLVERIAVCAWRLRRTYRVEAEMFNAFRQTKPQFHDTELATVFDRASQEMSVLSRYEVALDRAMHQAALMLERRQARREDEAVLPPIAVQITGHAAEPDAPGFGATRPNFQTKPNFSVESTSISSEDRIASGESQIRDDESAETQDHS